MNFSAILDISSFFIGMIINLLLIALICYYFKRKYENLEIAQNEQAKVLYQLLQQNVQPRVRNLSDILNDKADNIKENKDKWESPDSDSESDSDTESESETKINEIKTIHIDLDENDVVDECEEITLDTTSKVELEKELKLDLNIESNESDSTENIDEKDYSKMNIKQLKEILSVKGINVNKMKKNDMIELIEKTIEKSIDKSLDKSLDKNVSE